MLAAVLVSPGKSNLYHSVDSCKLKFVSSSKRHSGHISLMKKNKIEKNSLNRRKQIKIKNQNPGQEVRKLVHSLEY